MALSTYWDSGNYSVTILVFTLINVTITITAAGMIFLFDICPVQQPQYLFLYIDKNLQGSLVELLIGTRTKDLD